jgi:hypothetical protein
MTRRPLAAHAWLCVRVLEGILAALEGGKPVELKPFIRSTRIDAERQRMTLDAVSTPELVHAATLELAGRNPRIELTDRRRLLAVGGESQWQIVKRMDR